MNKPVPLYNPLKVALTSKELDTVPPNPGVLLQDVKNENKISGLTPRKLDTVFVISRGVNKLGPRHLPLQLHLLRGGFVPFGHHLGGGVPGGQDHHGVQRARVPIHGTRFSARTSRLMVAPNDFFCGVKGTPKPPFWEPRKKTHPCSASFIHRWCSKSSQCILYSRPEFHVIFRKVILTAISLDYVWPVHSDSNV